jgi:hypothetical protein
VIAGALYVAMDILVAMQYPGYSIAARQESELSAIGAPTRPLWIAVSTIYAPLMLAFGIGVWLAAQAKRALRAAGGLLVAFPMVGALWLLLAPMNPIGQVRSTTDSMHLVFAAAQIVVMLLFMTFGAVALGPGFRLFSVVVIVTMLAAGGFVGTQATAIAAGQGAPWLGLVERVSVFAPMVWIIAFGLALLRGRQEHPAIERRDK